MVLVSLCFSYNKLLEFIRWILVKFCNHKDFKILKFAFNFKFAQINIGIHLENYRRGLYIKHAELYFHKYEKHNQDLVQIKKRTREMAIS